MNPVEVLNNKHKSKHSLNNNIQFTMTESVDSGSGKEGTTIEIARPQE